MTLDRRSRLTLFQAALLDADVDPEVLRRDPSGETWLPVDLRALVRDDAECRALVQEFSRAELAMFDGADLGNDPLFTARVVRSLPLPLEGAGLALRRRRWILAAAYGMAVSSAYVTWWHFAPGQLSRWVSSAQLVLEDGARLGAVWAVAVAVLVAAIALTLPRTHTPTA